MIIVIAFMYLLFALAVLIGIGLFTMVASIVLLFLFELLMGTLAFFGIAQ